MGMLAPEDADLIGSIYEAAVMTDRWPGVLQAIADRFGARGAMYMVRSPSDVSFVASPRLEQHVADYVAEGWASDTQHAGPLFADQFPGFRTETDYRTPEEIAALPVHAEFLDPRGFVAGVGTIFQGSSNDALHLTLEGYPDHDSARAAVAGLDMIRSHLGRALSLTAQARTARDQATVAALALAGVGAAVVASDGRQRAANPRFTDRAGEMMSETRSGLRFIDPFLDAQLRASLSGLHARSKVQSIGVKDAGGRAFVIHVLPLVGAARDRTDSDGVLLLLAEPENVSVPEADLLRLLFDLTPAEAVLTRALIEGKTVAEFAALRSLSDATVRTQIRSVFAKTGVTRQVELVRLLSGLGSPLDRSAI